MKRVLFAVVLLLLIQAIGYCQDQLLQLIIKSDKQVYEVGEEIKINLTLKNIGKENITIIKRTGYQHTDLIIDGLNRHGRLVKEYGENPPLTAYYYIYPYKDDFLILKPNEHWNATIYVFESIEAEIIKELLKETGRHTISVLYYIDDAQVKNASELGFQLSTLKLVSNTITVEVVKKKSAQPLQLTIKSDRQVYEVRESISINSELKNISNKPIKVSDYYKPIGLEIYFKNVHEEKCVFNYIDVLRRVMPTELCPNESISVTGVTFSLPNNVTEHENYNVMGKHSIYMVDGDLTSNSITIEVVASTLSKEEIITTATNKLKEIHYNLVGMEAIYDEGNQKWNKEWNRRRNYFGNLPEIYPPLVGRNYQAVYFSPRETKGLRAPGIWVFVDRETNKVIEFQEEAN